MTVHFSTAVRNARGQATETTVGTTPKLRFYASGSTPPANCAATVVGTLLAELALPSDWMSAPSGGVESMAGTWSGTASASGDPDYYRIYDAAGTTCHEQGSVTVTGGGGDMTVASGTITNGDTVTVTSYSQTEGNA